MIANPCEVCSGCVKTSLLEAVSHLPDRDDVLWIRGIVLELLAQLGDVRIHGACHDERTVSPDFLEKLGARRHRAVPSHQCKEQLVRFWSERAVRSTLGHRARTEIHDDVAEAQLLARF